MFRNSFQCSRLMGRNEFFWERCRRYTHLSVFVASLANVNSEYCVMILEDYSLYGDWIDIILFDEIFRKTQWTLIIQRQKRETKTAANKTALSKKIHRRAVTFPCLIHSVFCSVATDHRPQIPAHNCMFIPSVHEWTWDLLFRCGVWTQILFWNSVEMLTLTEIYFF